jgi:hypothetical protein
MVHGRPALFVSPSCVCVCAHLSLQYEKAMNLGRPWDPYYGAPSDWVSLLDMFNFDLERKKSANVSILQELLFIQNELRSPYR